MKSIVTTAVVGVFLFVGAAGLSWVLIYNPPETPEDGVAEVESVEETNRTEVADASKKPSLPVSLRPETPLTVEAVAELAQSIMKKEKALFDAEQKLKQEEKRVGLLFEDLDRQRDELDAQIKKIDARIVQANEAVRLLKLEKEAVTKEKDVLSSLEKKVGKKSGDIADDHLRGRIKAVRGWFKNLEPDQAAEYLKEFADRGDVEFVAGLLGSQEERQIAKVLAAFDNPPLVAQIVDSFTKKRTQSKGKKRFLR